MGCVGGPALPFKPVQEWLGETCIERAGWGFELTVVGHIAIEVPNPKRKDTRPIFTFALQPSLRFGKVLIGRGLDLGKTYQHSIHTVMRISCKECGKEFQKRTKKSAEMALRMHQGRVHGNIKNGGTNAHQEAPTRTNAHRRELTEEQKEARRQYQRDRRAALKAGRIGGSKVKVYQDGSQIELHHCPRCGMDLDQLALALMAVQRS